MVDGFEGGFSIDIPLKVEAAPGIPSDLNGLRRFEDHFPLTEFGVLNSRNRVMWSQSVYGVEGNFLADGLEGRRRFGHSRFTAAQKDCCRDLEPTHSSPA